VVTEGEFIWQGSREQERVAELPRKPSCTNIFHALTLDSIIKEMIEKAHETKKKGAHSISVEEVREYWAVRVFL